MSSNVTRCPEKRFSDGRGMQANRGKPGKKKYATRKAVCTAGKGGGGTNDAEPCRAEGAEAPCLLMVPCIFTKGFL